MNYRDWIKVVFLIVFCMFLFDKQRPNKERKLTKAERVEKIMEDAKFMQFMFNEDYKKYLHRKMAYDVTFTVVDKWFLEVPEVDKFGRKYTDIRHLTGYCDIFQGEVTLTMDNWERASFFTNMATVYHELGHCKLDRVHLQDMSLSLDKQGTKVTNSMMNLYTLKDKDFLRFKDHYLRELFYNNPVYWNGRVARLFNPMEKEKCPIEAY